MSLQYLDAEHLAPLKQALNNLLSTTIAEQTYAQIIDGMPFASVYAEDRWFREGLLVMQHKELYACILEKTRRFLSRFDILSLEIPPKVEKTYPETLCYGIVCCETNLATQILQACQNTKLDSVAWKVRLLELVHAEWADWRSERLASLPENARGRDRTKCGPPTLFFAPLYKDPERFSIGLADVAANWAELRISEGVVLFDRGQTEEECNGIYVHSSLPTTLTPPTEKQFNDLVDFLVSPSSDRARCPLPIELATENKWRWDPYRGMAECHIYKYRQEIPETRPRTHCSERPGDWPEMFEYQTAVAEMRKEEAREPYGEGAWEKLARVSMPTSMYWGALENEIYKEL